MKKITFDMRLRDGDEAIPAGAIDWSRFEKNPVILMEHNWAGDPIGVMTSLNKEELTGIPMFHEITAMSGLHAQMNRDGYSNVLVGYPGGVAERDADGKIIKFTIYEISLLL